MGNLVFQATLGGQVNLVGPNTASTFNLNVPAVSSTIATTSGTETLTNKTLTSPVISGGTIDNAVIGGTTAAAGSFTTLSASSTLSVTGAGTIQGLTVGKGAGAVSTNTAVGASALAANISGSRSVAVGDFALTSNTTGYRNVALGSEALYANTTGYYNTGLGWRTLNVNTTGNENTGSGYYALLNNTTGSFNTAYGGSALQSNTTASNNTAVGYQAGYSNTTGTITAVGYKAGYSATTVVGGVYVGDQAGQVATGTNNTFIGSGAGFFVTSGAKNTILGGYGGNSGGLDIRTASNYIVLSDGDGNPRGIFDGSGNLLVGTTTSAGGSTISSASAAGVQTLTVVKSAVAKNTANNYYMQFNGSDGADGYIQTNGSSVLTIVDVSDIRLKDNVVNATYGINTIMALRPVEYSWIGQTQRVKGFIAQEVKNVLPESVSVKDDSALGGLEDMHLLEMQTMIPVLVKAVQEQQAIIESLKARLDAANL